MNQHYDVFVSYSHDDKWWVHEWLLPRLTERGLTVCIDTSDFEVGVPTLVNIEQAVSRSDRTILVLTPAWVESEWTEFESILAGTEDPAARRQTLLPLLLEDCDIPKRLQTITYADFRDEARWPAELDRLLGIIETERAVDDATKNAADCKVTEDRLRCYRVALTQLLSLQYPWGEWSDRRTSLEHRMGERQEFRGVSGPKPNVARTLFSLDALEPFSSAVADRRDAAIGWIESNVRDGWYREWTPSGTPDSETALPALKRRVDIRHSAEALTALMRWHSERDPIARLASNLSNSALESGFWPETPADTAPRLLATTYAVEALGRLILGEFRLPMTDLLPDRDVTAVRSAFRRGTTALLKDADAGDGLVGSVIGEPTPYLTGISLFRLAPLADEFDDLDTLVEKMTRALLVQSDTPTWKDTAVPVELRDRTETRTTLRVVAGLVRAAETNAAGDLIDSLDSYISQVAGYASGQGPLKLDSPDYACLLISLNAEDARYATAVDIDSVIEDAETIRSNNHEFWESNMADYLSRLERGRSYGRPGYEELAEELESKIDHLTGGE